MGNVCWIYEEIWRNGILIYSIQEKHCSCLAHSYSNEKRDSPLGTDTIADRGADDYLQNY